MKHQKKTSKKKGLVICVVLAVLLVLVIAGAAFLVVSNDGGSTGRTAIEAEVDAKDSSADSAMSSGDGSDSEGIIPTIYMDLACPKWVKDSMRVREIAEDDFYRLDFSGLITDREFELFSILFAKESSEGSLLGTLKTEDEGLLEVRIVIEPLECGDSWSEEQTNEARMLQEYANDVIDQLNANEDFTPAKQ